VAGAGLAAIAGRAGTRLTRRRRGRPRRGPLDQREAGQGSALALDPLDLGGAGEVAPTVAFDEGATLAMWSLTQLWSVTLSSAKAWHFTLG
jgi:hypothetical protein